MLLCSVFFQAASHGHTDCVRMLLEHGADTQLTDSFGITPIQQAVNKGHDDIVALLRSKTPEPKN